MLTQVPPCMLVVSKVVQQSNGGEGAARKQWHGGVVRGLGVWSLGVSPCMRTEPRPPLQCQQAWILVHAHGPCVPVPQRIWLMRGKGGGGRRQVSLGAVATGSCLNALRIVSLSKEQCIEHLNSNKLVSVCRPFRGILDLVVPVCVCQAAAALLLQRELACLLYLITQLCHRPPRARHKPSKFVHFIVSSYSFCWFTL